jgi:outer membrane protein insertion porin family
VIRREFDIAEGDAYNRALIDRAERRLNDLGYFKTVKITDESGSTPDRVVVTVNVEEGLTGDFWISGGYSTAYGLIAEVTAGERNFLGRGEYVKASVTYGQYVHGFAVSFAEPYFLGSRMTLGLDMFERETLANSYQSYGSTTYGTGIKLASPLTEQLSMDWHYSIYSQSLTLAPALMDCSSTNPPPGCYANGEASLPIKQAVLEGPALVSLAGNTLTWNTLDDNRNPKNGIRADLRQDIAGLGGNVNFFRTTADFRSYHEVTDDLVGMARLQGGNVTPWGGRPLPLLNGFFGGPQMVRGFAPNGFGPRDLTPGTTMDNVGGGAYWASTAELQAPVPNLPAQAGLKVAVFADAGSVWGYRGPTVFTAFGQPLQVASSSAIRSSVGAGLIWASPFGPLRVDYAVAATKTSYDVLQPFRFSAGGF